MAKINIISDLYGEVSVRDCIIEGSSKMLEEGVSVHEEAHDELLFEVIGYTTEDFENDDQLINTLIEALV